MKKKPNNMIWCCSVGWVVWYVCRMDDNDGDGSEWGRLEDCAAHMISSPLEIT